MGTMTTGLFLERVAWTKMIQNDTSSGSKEATAGDFKIIHFIFKLYCVHCFSEQQK